MSLSMVSVIMGTRRTKRKPTQYLTNRKVKLSSA